MFDPCSVILIDAASQHPHQHHEFAPPVNQAQILDFQRSSVFIHGQEANRDPANYSNASNADILNLDVPEMGADIGDEFIYPSQTEPYVQQQHQHFQQRTVYERRGSSREDEEVPSMYVLSARGRTTLYLS